MSEAHTPARPTLPTEATDKVTLRELEQRLESLQKLIDERTRYEREILSTRENAIKDALTLASADNERRLVALNHAHAEAQQNWARTLPRELFDAWLRDFDKWKETVNTTLTAAAPQREYIRGIDQRVSAMERTANRITGALVLLGTMGIAGVLALLLGLARLAGLLN